MEQGFYLGVDILGGEAEFLVEDFVGCGETETVQSPHFAILADQPF